MNDIFLHLAPMQWLIACLIGVVAGFIKGAVGFGMPMILISGLSLIVAPEVALAGLIIPTLVTNGIQALRHGIAPAVASMKRFRVFLLTGLVCLLASAQLVRALPIELMLLMIGVPISVFTLLQLAGWTWSLKSQSSKFDAAIGGFAGFIGGLSGVWGPPTVLYLTALGTEKAEQMRVQGVIYGLASVGLLGAHIASGVLRIDTAPFSVSLVPPALVGMWLGSRVLRRINQEQFRRATLLVLLLVGLNLIRRAVFN